MVIIDENKREGKKKEKEKQLKDFKSNNKPLPEGKYEVILADPPWKYDFSKDSTDSIEYHNLRRLRNES